MMLCRLESLPAELLEPIFRHSSNVNLALCSDIIGAKLSNGRAFEEMANHHLFPSSPAGKRNTDAKSPQYVILASKYVTFTRFKIYFTAFLAWEMCNCAVTCWCQIDAAEDLKDAILAVSRGGLEGTHAIISRHLLDKLYKLFKASSFQPSSSPILSKPTMRSFSTSCIAAASRFQNSIARRSPRARKPSLKTQPCITIR
jgi:hypothetical protein